MASRLTGVLPVLGAIAAVALLPQALVAQSRAPAPTDDILAGKPRFSQHKEELIIRHFFKDRRQGVFLDVGSASPLENSNTAYLERNLDWSGIAVDALPEFAGPWSRKRPRTRFFNFLVSDHSDTVESFFRSELRGISSAKKPETGPANRPVDSEEIKVPTITLSRLLEVAGVSHVDLLSLDIEGHEPQALDGFDIERYRPELVCVEAKPFNRQVLSDYFTRHGYVRIDSYLEHDQVNWYFTPGKATKP
jgi:FkbM family methyltransferase